MAVRAHAKVSVIGVALVALGVLVAAPVSSAFATSGTATLTGGSLSMATPAVVTFAATLNGAAQVAPSTQVFDVSDNTGSGSGWNITLTSTTFTGSAGPLSTAATTDTGASGACDASITCVLGTNSGVSYPVTVPAGTTAPAAIKIQGALANTGLAGQTWTHNMALAIPATARFGAYFSTWTYSLVSGP